MKKRVIKGFKATFLAGLVVLVPSALTVFVVWKLFQWLDGLLGKPALQLLESLLQTDLGLSQLPGIGLIALLLLILAAGVFAGNYLGRKLFQLGDFIILKIPVVRHIYSTFQQISQSFFSDRSETFKRAVIFEYPRPGMYSIGFITQDTRGHVQEQLQANNAGDCFSIFLPTTPNPTSGYLLFVPKDQIILLNITVEEALKLIISGGSVTPEHVKQSNNGSSQNDR